MEPFDRDCFTQECVVQSSPPPPSLTRVHDSGMRDPDDMRCRDAARHIDQTPGFMEADHPAEDGPPDREGPPAVYSRRKHSVGGMESVLSGSEEDIHLESINTFFERHGRLAGPREPAEPSQERLEEQGEVILEKELWSDGPRASGSDLQETVAVLHSLPARSEAALGTDATQTAKGNININTMNKAGADFETTPGGADGSSVAETNKLTNPETKLLIKEDRLMTTATHKSRQHSQYRGPSDDFICLENTLGWDRALSSETCKRWPDAEYEQPSLTKPCSVVGVAVDERLQKVNINLLLPGLDTNPPNRNAGKDRPQSDYSRKRRKRKKRCSSLLEKREHRGQLSTESEEQQSAQRTGMDPRLSKNHSEVQGSEKPISDCVFAGSLPSTDVTQTSSFIENPSNYSYPLTPLSDNQHGHVSDNPDSLAFSSASFSDRQCNTLHCPPANTSSHKSFSTNGQADDSLAPTPADGANVATHLQAKGPSQQNKSTGSTLTPGSLTLTSVCERSFLSVDESAADHAGTLPHFHEKKHSLAERSCKSGGKSHFYAAKVNSTTNSVSHGGDSNDPMMEADQNDEEPNGEQSNLAAEMGFSGKDNPTDCPRDAQHSQKLEIDCHKTVPLSSSDLPRSTIVMIGSDAQGLAQELKIGLSTVDNPVDGHFNLDFSKVSPNAENTSPNSQHVDTIPEFSVFAGNTSTAGIKCPGPHITTVHSCDTSSFQSVEMSSNTSISLEGLLNNRSVAADTPKLTQSYGGLCSTDPSKFEQNIADMSDNTPQVLDTDKRDQAINEVERQEASQDTSELKCPIEGPDTTSETGEDVSNAPDSKNKVFAMSSFWNEMERLTINDILGLRMISTTLPPQSLSPLVESEETDNSESADSGYFTPQLDDTKTVATIPDLEQAKVNSAASIHDASFSSLEVMWDGGPSPVSLAGGIYPENMMLTSDTDNPQPQLSTSSEERRRRQMLKNTSVHNLHAMYSEQFSQTRRVQTLAAVILEESESERECFSDVQKPCGDCGTDSMSSSLFAEGTPAESYRISLTAILKCLFGGKQSNPKPPDSEDPGTYYSRGNTVPETYDLFFSEFDCGSFFYPFNQTEDRPKDELVPIFSRSRSSSKYLQYPEAYDHFLSSSSSSDDSSTESEGGDLDEDLGPIRVVTRFSHRTTEAQTSTDIYENFFTDLDLRNNLFWNTTFSLRNFRLTGVVSQKQQRSGPLTPVDQSTVQRRRRVFSSINVLGHQDTVVPDPALYHFEERIYRQLNPFSFDDLQSAVSHPSLGVSLVPLRQSDMCLVCIAFASWVLKSANPHVGDAWKAVESHCGFK
ncbi:unnamed protein product [Lota lota]